MKYDTHITGLHRARHQMRLKGIASRAHPQDVPANVYAYTILLGGIAIRQGTPTTRSIVGFQEATTPREAVRLWKIRNNISH